MSGGTFLPHFFSHSFVRRESASEKLFLGTHLHTNCTQRTERTTENGEESNVSTNCKDILLSTYKTNTTIICIFSFRFSLKRPSMLERTGCVKCETPEKSSEKSLVQYTVLITDGRAVKRYVVSVDTRGGDKRLSHVSDCDLLHWHEFW